MSLLLFLKEYLQIAVNGIPKNEKVREKSTTLETAVMHVDSR